MTLLNALNICLKNNGKSFDDILWIGCNNFYVDKEAFKLLADKVDDTSCESWNPAYQLPVDLMIVGKDFVIVRDCAAEDIFDTRPLCLQQLRMYLLMPRPTEKRSLKTLLSSEITHAVCTERYNGICGVKLIDYTY